MNYSEPNIFIWLIFTIYAITLLFIVPSTFSYKALPKSAEEYNEQAISNASKFLARIALMFPMIALLNNL